MFGDTLLQIGTIILALSVLPALVQSFRLRRRIVPVGAALPVTIGLYFLTAGFLLVGQTLAGQFAIMQSGIWTVLLLYRGRPAPEKP